MDFESIIDELIELSPSVSDYMSSMRYMMLSETTDSITESLILNSCYKYIIDDLQDIGINFHIDFDDIVANHYDFKYIVWLLRFFKPVNFLTFIKANDTIVDFIENEIDEIADNELIVIFLQRISLFMEIKDELIFLFDKIYSTGLFRKYMQNAIRLHIATDTENAVEINPDVFKEFVAYYKSCMTNISNILKRSKDSFWYFHSMESIFEKYFMNNVFSNNHILSPISEYYYNSLNLNNEIKDTEILSINCKKAYKNYSMISDDHALFYKTNNIIPKKETLPIIAITLLVEEKILPFDLEVGYKKSFNIIKSLSPELAIIFEKIWANINGEK